MHDKEKKTDREVAPRGAQQGVQEWTGQTGTNASDDAIASEELRYRASYRDAPYYSVGRNWHDYAPAYHYGHVAHDAHPGERFESVERELAGNWERRKQSSRLVWAEARGAVRDIWNQLDRANPRQR